jgi:hypothetical protein
MIVAVVVGMKRVRRQEDPRMGGQTGVMDTPTPENERQLHAWRLYSLDILVISRCRAYDQPQRYSMYASASNSDAMPSRSLSLSSGEKKAC